MLLLSLLLLPATLADLTLYNGVTSGSASATSATVPAAAYTGALAYDTSALTPPAPPSPATTAVTITLPSDPVGAGLNLSIAQKGNFLGFSVELSVANTLLGDSPTQLKPVFLNYMANIRNRAGQGPIIRVGGNSQESSTIFASGLSDGASIDKIKSNSTTATTTSTPIINYSPELLYTMANVTSLVDIEWFFGLSFNESAAEQPSGNVPIAASYASSILGKSLRGLQIGNEPDLYVDHSLRPSGWGVSNYVSEFSSMVSSVVSTGTLSNQASFVGPSVCCQAAGFEVSDIFNAGWLQDNINNLAAVTVQHYPTNNCQINGNVISAQSIFGDFLNHTSAQYLTSLYLDTSAQTLAAGKELFMLEMNTASCGGFAGLSDSFGAAMWMTDWALQLAWGNFSAALMHVGGQNVYYNPFTPPPSNQSSTLQWTTGSVYYSSLVVAEVFGSSNASQIVDLLPTAADMYHPAYAVYESGSPTRVVLFNYVSDSSGASTYEASISVPASTSSVSVRYLLAPSVSEQYNITWAGQTLGTSYESDGRLYGTLSTSTVTCNSGTCVVSVPAPAIAIVYLTSTALADSSVTEGETSTYATTVIGKGSATVAPGTLQTSNGQNGPLGSSSKGSATSDAQKAQLHIGLGVLAIAIGMIVAIGRGI